MPRSRLLPLLLWLLALSGALPSATLGDATSPGVSGGLEGERGLSIGVQFLPPHFNPLIQVGHTSYLVAAQLHASPLRMDAEGRARPYLARAWEVSPDRLAITLHLDEAARFHDDTPVTADDVAFSLLALRDHHPFKPLYAAIESVETPDPHTAVIRLRHPHPAWELMLSPLFGPILPRHVYGDGRPLADHPANLAPVGAGPFRFVSLEGDRRLTLARWEGFRLPSPARLTGIEYRAVGLEGDVTLLLRHGQVDLAPGLYSGRAEVRGELAGASDLVVSHAGKAPIAAHTALVFNLRHAPLDDVRVRRAIAMVLDRQRAIQVLSDGRDVPILGPIPETSPLYTPLADPYPFQPEEANRLLDEAGHPRNPAGRRFSITLDYLPSELGMAGWADWVRYDLGRLLGIDVTLHHNATIRDWAVRTARGDFDLNLWALFYLDDPLVSVHRTYHSMTVGDALPLNNDMGYQSPAADALLDAAGQEVDPGRRRDLYARLQRVLLDDMPAYIYSHIEILTAHHRDLIGLGDSRWGVLAPLDRLHWRTPGE